MGKYYVQSLARQRRGGALQPAAIAASLGPLSSCVWITLALQYFKHIALNIPLRSRSND